MEQPHLHATFKPIPNYVANHTTGVIFFCSPFSNPCCGARHDVVGRRHRTGRGFESLMYRAHLLHDAQYGEIVCPTVASSVYCTCAVVTQCGQKKDNGRRQWRQSKWTAQTTTARTFRLENNHGRTQKYPHLTQFPLCLHMIMSLSCTTTRVNVERQLHPCTGPEAGLCSQRARATINKFTASWFRVL